MRGSEGLLLTSAFGDAKSAAGRGLPFTLVAGAISPAHGGFLGLIFLALDRIGRDLEWPFANSEHDVPLGAIIRTIEIDLGQMLGEENVLKPLEPGRNVLW
jgi:ion channel-forming bestrophin family protein